MLGEKLIDLYYASLEFCNQNTIIFRFISYVLGFISGIFFFYFINNNNIIGAILVMVISILIMELFYKNFHSIKIPVHLSDDFFDERS